MYTSTTTTTTTTTTTPDTTATGSLQHAPRVPSLHQQARRELRDLLDPSAPIKEVINSLHSEIAGLPASSHPDFGALLKICTNLKQAEDCLKQAQRLAPLRQDLDLLGKLLPKLFKQIDSCLERSDSLKLPVLQTLCMGLSTLADPLNRSLLTEAQRQQSKAVLTHISNQLAQLLAGHFKHGVSDQGILLNCLNWFTRALKADLVQKDQLAVRGLFDVALNQMHDWSAGSGQQGYLNGRQLAKCMVQLNTMIRQSLVNLGADKAGQANRQLWVETVQNLCGHFLANGEWTKQCTLVELTNVTNTLKDGLEQGFLRGTDAGLIQAFAILAERISKHGFSLQDDRAVVSLGNTANFLRCLFEFDLLGSVNSSTGKAVLHLVSALKSTSRDMDLTGGSAQALANLASFIKAADRWLAMQPREERAAWQASLAYACGVLVQALSGLNASDQHWMRSPVTGSALLAALQHWLQRGLVSASQSGLLRGLLRHLVESIPAWKQGECPSQSVLQSLRALAGLVKSNVLPDLLAEPAVGPAFRVLLLQLQQSPPARYSDDERLGSLQAAQIALGLNVLSLTDLQPLLQHLLQTKEAVDSASLAQAIAELGGRLATLETLEPTALADAVDPVDVPLSPSSEAKGSKPLGQTYRGEAAAKVPTILSAHQLSADWVTVEKGPKPVVRRADTSTLVTMSSTLPTLVTRPAENKKVTETKVAAASARSEKARQVKPVGQGTLTLSLSQAQKEWFQLLSDQQAVSLERLKALVGAYPSLLTLKAPGRRGQVALFYALTLGKKDVAEWLMRQDPSAMNQPLGEFLVAALNEIGFIEKRHIAALRVFIESYLKHEEQQLRAVHYAKQAVEQPLSRQEIFARRATLLSEASKAALGQFAELKRMLEEYKLISPAAKASPEVAKAVQPARAAQVAEPMQIQQSLSWAIAVNDLAAVKSILAAKNKKGEAQQADNLPAMLMALMAAAQHGHVELVSQLLQAVANKDALAQIRTDEGWTALMAAAQHGHVEVVRQLLQAVKDKDALEQIRNNDGLTALMVAAYNGHVEVVSQLLQAVKDKYALIRISLKDGENALSLALKESHKEIFSQLMEAIEAAQ